MSETMPPGWELDRLVAEKVLGWVWRRSRETGRRCLYPPTGPWPTWMDQPADGSEPLVTFPASAMVPSLRLSTVLSTTEAAAEEARKAGKFDAWDVHQFETASASTGRLMPNGRTLAWADAVQGEQRAHALALALLAACGGAA